MGDAKEVIPAACGPYIPERLIGQGGVAEVWQARDRRGNDVAVKIVNRAFSASQPEMNIGERFADEAQALTELQHPHIVRMLSWGEDPDRWWIAMPYIRGGSLSRTMSHLGDKRLNFTLAIRYTIQMCGALTYVHGCGIIHRDVKPANILISGEDPQHCYLTDFGIARLVTNPRLTTAKKAIGTPEYMSPEQARGQDVDGKADVYALACALYEMLVDHPPFWDGSPMEIASAHVHGKIPRITDNRAVNDGLLLLLLEALDKNPAQRPTAVQFAHALAPFLRRG
ncbi:MAG: serine/threonine protein kinase [Ktedonobacterales bacterium]|nr:serine/threonine protein kinase [Ktedonobacterales bacterium]